MRFVQETLETISSSAQALKRVRSQHIDGFCGAPEVPLDPKTPSPSSRSAARGLGLLTCGFVCGRYRTRTCDPLLVRNKQGLEYMGFAGPIPVYGVWVLVVGCFVLLRSGWCPRGAPESHFHIGDASSADPVLCRHSPTYIYCLSTEVRVWFRAHCAIAYFTKHRVDIKLVSELTGCVGADAASIAALIQRMREAGVKRLFLKSCETARNNRRQIYLPDGLIQVFKLLSARQYQHQHPKVKSKPGTPIPTARVQWTWLGDGPRSPAPETKLILYSHPETRLSGFISGSPNPPDALREHLKGNYGERWLLFGQAGEETLGAVAAAPLGERVDLPIPLAEVSI